MLKDAQLKMFRKAVVKLRPQLFSICLQVQRYNWLSVDVWGGLLSRLKLECIDLDTIINEPLDSDILRCYFELDSINEDYHVAIHDEANEVVP